MSHALLSFAMSAALAGFAALPAAAHQGAAHAATAAAAVPATATATQAPIELIDQDHRPFTAARLRDRHTLLTFGFTQCSSTCPSSMQVAREVVKTLGAQAPQVVLVTLDPLTDDPERLARYVRQFDTRFIGVTGSPLAIDRIAAQFRVGRRGTGPALQHSAMWYLVGPSGEIQTVLPFSSTPARIVDELRRLQRIDVATR